MSDLETRAEKTNLDMVEYFWNVARHMPFIYMTLKPAVSPLIGAIPNSLGVFQHYSSKSLLEWISFGAGSALVAAGFFMKHRTDEHIEKIMQNMTLSHPELQTGGQYRFTRNPLYVAQTAVVLGASLMEPGLDSVAALAAYAGLTNKCVSAEERACERLFGQKYAEYKEMHPRWPNGWGILGMALDTIDYYKRKFSLSKREGA